jgi:glucose dehydrogenase
MVFAVCHLSANSVPLRVEGFHWDGSLLICPFSAPRAPWALDFRTSHETLCVKFGCAHDTRVTACAHGDRRPSANRRRLPEKNIANSKNWATQAGDMFNQRYSKLKQINQGNVGKMQVAWTFSTGVLRGHEGGPLVIGDTMYLHSRSRTRCSRSRPGRPEILWKYEPKQDPAVIPVMCCDTVNRGVAYAEGKVFLQQADTTLVALDAKTGKVVCGR